jgi:hypothetical protein
MSSEKLSIQTNSTCPNLSIIWHVIDKSGQSRPVDWPNLCGKILLPHAAILSLHILCSYSWLMVHADKMMQIQEIVHTKR